MMESVLGFIILKFILWIFPSRKIEDVSRGRTWVDPVDYYALLASLTQVGNLEACFLTGIQTIFMEKHSP